MLTGSPLAKDDNHWLVLEVPVQVLGLIDLASEMMCRDVVQRPCRGPKYVSDRNLYPEGIFFFWIL